jgi:uncharacterized membrane protein SpoIIM required for sporulation
LDSDRKVPIRPFPLIATLITVAYGVVSGLMAGPAPPQQFYLSMGPITKSVLGKLSTQQFEFSYLLGEYIANNVGLWVVLFFLGSLVPVFTFDILSWNMRMVTQVTMYLPPGTTMAIMMLHGVYELAAVILMSYCSYYLFYLIVRELVRRPLLEETLQVIKATVFSLMALFMAALLEAYVTPIIFSPSSGDMFLRGVQVSSLYDYVFYTVFLGGAYAIPLIIAAGISLEFWEYVFGAEAKYPFGPPPPQPELLPSWVQNFNTGVLEELIFRAPVLILAKYYNPFEVAAFFSILFGFAHHTYGIAKIPSSFTVGMVFSAIAFHFGLGPAIVSHAFLDLYLFLASYAEKGLLR